MESTVRVMAGRWEVYAIFTPQQRRHAEEETLGTQKRRHLGVNVELQDDANLR
jgi:hypothetical protein